jgi:thiol-disulfide isomerase/thioredoxin
VYDRRARFRSAARAAFGAPRFAVVLALLWPLTACAHTHTLPRPQSDVASRWAVVGERAPQIALRSLDDGEQRLSGYSGRVVVVTFWTTFCGPCRQELPALEALRTRYPDLVVLAVSLDEDDDDARVRDVASELHLHFPILRDAQGRAAFEYMKIAATPLTAIVGRDGRLRALHRGYLPPLAARLDTEVRTALAEMPAVEPGQGGP